MKVVSDQGFEQETKTPSRFADWLPNSQAESQAKKKIKLLWQHGDLFHAATRYPRKPNVARVDRLVRILQSGLLAPVRCQDGSVLSDLSITVTGSSVAYDSLVFLHRFGPQSGIYITREPGRFAVFIDPGIPVLTPQSLEPDWVILCRDEVYVPDHIPPEKLIGVAVHPADAESVMSELIDDFRRLEIPLYDFDGNVLWPDVAENAFKED